MNIVIPEDVKELIDILNKNQHEAYICGGAVRDSILGITPKDWDICTSATPDEMLIVFEDEKIIPTGLKHGTITVVRNDIPFEVTTYRKDGDYSDNRRPDNVEFTDDLLEDLKRRDFTINAIVMDKFGFIIDPFNGRIDINNKIIRCVGNPNERFEEDALRVLRALRFSARYGFRIDNKTAIALNQKSYLLKNISKERINDELCKILMGKGCATILKQYPMVFRQIIPEVSEMMIYSPYNIWRETIHCFDAIYNKEIEYDIITRLTILLRYIGKPYADEYHIKVSTEITNDILTNLRFSNDIKNKVVQLVSYQNSLIIPTKTIIKKLLNKLGEEQLRRLLLLRELDIRYSSIEAHEAFVKIYILLDEILKNEECYQLKDLAVNGKDLIEWGIPQGKQIGDTLNELLIMVMNGEVKNTKEELKKIIEVTYGF